MCLVSAEALQMAREARHRRTVYALEARACAQQGLCDACHRGVYILGDVGERITVPRELGAAPQRTDAQLRVRFPYSTHGAGRGHMRLGTHECLGMQKEQIERVVATSWGQ